MGEAAGPSSVSDSKDLAGGSLLILSLELAEDLGAFGHIICSTIGGKVPVLDLGKGRGLFPFHHFPIRCGDRVIIARSGLVLLCKKLWRWWGDGGGALGMWWEVDEWSW